MTRLRIVPWALAAVVAAGCDDEGQREARALAAVRSPNSAEVDAAASALLAVLAQHPDDAPAELGYANYLRDRGRIDEARGRYERIVNTVRSDAPETIAAKEALAQIGPPPRPAPPPASTSASAPSPLAPTPITPGKGIGDLLLGRAPPDPDKARGPCELTRPTPRGAVCAWPSRGLEIETADGKITRVGVYRDGSETRIAGGKTARFRGFVGRTPDGLEVGMPEARVLALLGPTTRKRLPLGAFLMADSALALELWDYPKPGLTLRMDSTRGGHVVGAIELPTISGQPITDGPSPGKP